MSMIYFKVHTLEIYILVGFDYIITIYIGITPNFSSCTFMLITPILPAHTYWLQAANDLVSSFLHDSLFVDSW